METVETVVIGAGQAGLATSYWLKQLGSDHIVLEQAARPAHVWSDERCDSFTLVTPNWSFRLPGAAYEAHEPDGFLPRDEIARIFEHYVRHYDLPVRCNSRVSSIESSGTGGFRVRTRDYLIDARNVVVATGFFQTPRVPAMAANLSPRVTQLHSSAYRNPESIGEGGVLVVGSAQSGCQIAEELNEHGRTVFIATGRAGRAPRRYRGKDIIRWLEQVGFFDLTPEQLPSGMSKFEGIPHVSGTNGGHTINLHQFARDGIFLLGHVIGIEGNMVQIAPDLHDNLRQADQFELDAVGMIDGFIQENGIDAPVEELPKMIDGFAHPIVELIDLAESDVRTVIWATGYAFDYSMVKLPVCDSDGFPIQAGGVTSYPGLYFVGMPWMPTERSGFLLGVGESARSIANSITTPVSAS